MWTDELIDLTAATNPMTFVPSEPSDTQPGAFEVVEGIGGECWIASDLVPDTYPTAGRAFDALVDELVELPDMPGLVFGIRNLNSGEVIPI